MPGCKYARKGPTTMLLYFICRVPMSTPASAITIALAWLIGPRFFATTSRSDGGGSSSAGSSFFASFLPSFDGFSAAGAAGSGSACGGGELAKS